MKLNNGASVDYDWLVLALGSETNTFGVPGAREHAITFCSYSDVEKARPSNHDAAAPNGCISLCYNPSQNALHFALLVSVPLAAMGTPVLCDTCAASRDCMCCCAACQG